MSSYVDSNRKMDWAKEFSRTYPEPLDRSSMFGSLADAQKYAAGDITDPDSRQLCGNSYIGQIIAVYENDTVTTYVIGADRTLQGLGSELVPASPTVLGGIKLGANLAWNTTTNQVDATDTTYTLATVAAAGLMPQLLSSHDNKFLRADGTWVGVDVSTKQDLVEQIVLL